MSKPQDGSLASECPGPAEPFATNSAAAAQTPLQSPADTHCSLSRRQFIGVTTSSALMAQQIRPSPAMMHPHLRPSARELALPAALTASTLREAWPKHEFVMDVCLYGDFESAHRYDALALADDLSAQLIRTDAVVIAPLSASQERSCLLDAVECLNRHCASQRAVRIADIPISDCASGLNDMYELSESCRPDAWRLRATRSLGAEEAQQFLPYLDVARRVATRTICVEVPARPSASPGTETGAVASIMDLAGQHPELDFLVYPSAEMLKPGILQSGLHAELECFVPWASELCRQTLHLGLTNVYAHIGWLYGVTDPGARYGQQQALRQLLSVFTAERLVWGSVRQATVSAQSQWQRFRTDSHSRIAAVQNRYPLLDSQQKRLLSGLTAARLFGVLPTAARHAVTHRVNEPGKESF